MSDQIMMEQVGIVALARSIARDSDRAAGLAMDVRDCTQSGELDRAVGILAMMRPKAASVLAQIDAALALNVSRHTVTEMDRVGVTPTPLVRLATSLQSLVDAYDGGRLQDSHIKEAQEALDVARGGAQLRKGG